MSRFSNYAVAQPHASTAKPPNVNGFPNPMKGDRQDERSQSGSDDGNYAAYGDQKIEGELEDDSNTALTSQTLNADGTPKRPMNAFMIFARRRRPQVSAENQAMRTGEISKILSKEWVSMPQNEKQFYLEQAKLLKETFNTKYPDYVYRRRPNNSRKRRRSDGSTMRPVDQGLMGDHTDELGGPFDVDASPTDGDEQLDSGLSPSYPRPPHELPQAAIDHKFMNSRRASIGHPYSPPESSYRATSHDVNHSYSGPSSSERIGQNMPSGSSPRLSISALNYPYGQSSSHGQSPVYGGGESSVSSSQQGWPPRGSNWLGGQDRIPHDRAPAHIQTQKGGPYSPPTSWSNPSDAPSTSPNPPPSASNFGFPTLSTPFFPNQQPQSNVGHYQTNASISPTTTHAMPSHSASPPHYDTMSSLPPGSLTRDYGSRAYTSSTSIPAAGSTYANPPGRDTLPYPQQRTLPLPSVQPGYGSHSQPLSSTGSAYSNAQPFWRD